MTSDELDAQIARLEQSLGNTSSSVTFADSSRVDFIDAEETQKRLRNLKALRDRKAAGVLSRRVVTMNRGL